MLYANASRHNTLTRYVSPCASYEDGAHQWAHQQFLVSATTDGMAPFSQTSGFAGRRHFHFQELVMGRRIDDRDQRRGDSVTLRLRSHESDSIRRHAAARGWSLSQWLRVAI